MIYKFKRDLESGIIFVKIKLNNDHELKMALDTAASRTTFDRNALLMVNCLIGDRIETGMIETANGIVKVGVFKVGSLAALGHTIHDMPVQVYDFLAHGILSDYDGVLGIDFFENTEFTINMKNQTIEVKK